MYRLHMLCKYITFHATVLCRVGLTPRRYACRCHSRSRVAWRVYSRRHSPLSLNHWPMFSIRLELMTPTLFLGLCSISAIKTAQLPGAAAKELWKIIEKVLHLGIKYKRNSGHVIYVAPALRPCFRDSRVFFFCELVFHYDHIDINV